MQRKPITKEKALERLASMCGRSEQCESELINKLYRWGLKHGDHGEVLDYLKENRYYDDQRFAKSYAYDKARFSRWGPSKIRFELIKRKIKREYVAEALQNVGKEIWKEGLMKNAVSKARNLDLIGEGSRENRQKLYVYLISRGFPSVAVTEIVRKMIKMQQEYEDEVDK